METIVSFLTIILVVLLVGAALTFGFALLIWFGIFAAMITILMMLKQLWYRWRFMRTGGAPPEPETKIIEVDYEEISKPDKDE